MKSGTIKTALRIGAVIGISYLFKIHNSKSITGGNDSVTKIETKSGDEKKEEKEETENKIEESQFNTNRTPLFKLYDANPELFLEVYNRYMNDELSSYEAADLFGCGIDTFSNMVKYYRNKENLNEKKHRTNKKLAKYLICDTNPELFLEVYIKFISKEINSREAAKELGISVSTFYRSVRYYESKNETRGASIYK